MRKLLPISQLILRCEELAKGISADNIALIAEAREDLQYWAAAWEPQYLRRMLAAVKCELEAENKRMS